MITGISKHAKFTHPKHKGNEKMKTVKQFINGTIAALCLLPSSMVLAESVTSNEYQAVVTTAYNYVNGLANADQKMLANSLDLEFGDVKMLKKNPETQKETIRTVSLMEYVGFFKEATKDTWQAKVISVDIVDEKMAMVKLDFETPKTYYTDYLVMYKRDKNWRIINKTFIAKKKM